MLFHFLLSCVNVWFHPQVKQRADECILALDRLTQINSGIPVQNVLQTKFDWTTLEVTFSWTLLFFFDQLYRIYRFLLK